MCCVYANAIPILFPNFPFLFLHSAGLGIFTGIDLQEGDAVAEPDIVIPLHDQQWHTGDDLDFWFLWNEYSWQASEVGMQYDMEDGIALVIGTGCMPNCNFALNNAHEGKVRGDMTMTCFFIIL